MLLTNAQIQEIAKIIEDHHNAFVANAIGVETLTEDVINRLKEKGMIDPKINSIKDAYLYGQVMQVVGEKQASRMSYNEFKKYVARNPIPLNEIEQRAVDMAQLRAGQYAKALGNRIDVKTGATLISEDRELAAKTREIIEDATAVNIAKRESIQKLKSNLQWETKDWSRDWDRIAATENQFAMLRGEADYIAKKEGVDAKVFKRAYDDSCDHCKRLYTGSDGNPRIFKLSTLEANGVNVGRKTKDWLPTVGPVHPNCRCTLSNVPEGWGFNDEGDLVPGGEGGIEYKNRDELKLALLQDYDLQKAYKLQGHTDFQGLKIAIENQPGSYRHWKDVEGNEGKTLMKYAYGYIKKTNGQDEDEIDCFIGPNKKSGNVFIVHQNDPHTGKYDEDKVFLGFNSKQDTTMAYLQHYDSADYFGSISTMDMDQFKKWLEGTQVKSGEMASGVKLAIPMKKAKISTWDAAETSRAGDQNPGNGMVLNYIVRTPIIKKESKRHPSLDGFLDRPSDEELKHRREAFSRDKTVYEVRVPVKHPVKHFDYPDAIEENLISEDEAKRNKKWIEDMYIRRQSIPNRIPVRIK